jgi:hypothetical protein
LPRRLELPAADVELAERRLEVRLDGRVGDEGRLGDFGVRVALCDKSRDAQFAERERFS